VKTKILAGTATILVAIAALAIMITKEEKIKNTGSAESVAKQEAPKPLTEEQKKRAQETAEISKKLKACDALQDKNAYGKRWEDYAYMVPGHDGWVFRSKQDFRQEFKLDDEDTRLYKAFSDALKTRGTTLVLAVIPTRGIVATDKLPKDHKVAQGFDPAKAKQSYVEMLAKMNTAGVLAAGTPDPESGAAYFNIADQHWSTKGAHDMGRAVAAAIKGTPVWEALPREAFETLSGDTVKYNGRFGEAVRALCDDLRPPMEIDTQVKTVFAQDGADENALFGDKPAPKVVLVGTSNSLRDDFEANFSGFLKQELQADVYNAAISGGGMDDSLVAYLDSKEFRDNPPAILVWEIPGYYNLGGEGMENALRQGIASVYGYCDEPIVSFGPEKVKKERLYMVRGAGSKKIAQGSAYIAFTFDAPVKRDFSVSFKTSDKKNRYFKFTKRREGHGATFFYMPVIDQGKYLTDIALNPAKGIEGLTVRAKLCSINAL